MSNHATLWLVTNIFFILIAVTVVVLRLDTNTLEMQKLPIIYSFIVYSILYCYDTSLLVLLKLVTLSDTSFNLPHNSSKPHTFGSLYNITSTCHTVPWCIM